MIKITIIAVGKIKEKYWQEAIDEYSKRLRPYIKLKFIDLNEEKFKSINEKNQVLKNEGKKILKSVPRDSILICLDREAGEIDSVKLSEKIIKLSSQGQELTFIIGGPLGLDKEVIKQSKSTISFSKLTFPHQLAKVILMEQLYRSITIQTGKTYHY